MTGRYGRSQVGTFDERGSALLIALMVLVAMGVLGTAIVYNSVSDRHVSRYERDAADALAAAETGVAVAKRHIQDLTAPLADADADGQPDFAISDTLAWGGSYRVFAEAGDITDIDLSAYRSGGYTIVCEGNAHGAARRVKVELAHDSFLKYARFVESTGTSYSCRALVTGELYVGGDLAVPSCASGDEVNFLEFVAATGDIPNAAAGIFTRGYVTEAPQIDLHDSVDFDNARRRAQGTAPENSCEGQGSVGIYLNPAAGWDPIGLAGTLGVLDFSRFNFKDLTTSPPDTIVRYNGSIVTNATTGAPLRLGDFNGIIFFEGDGKVKGQLNGLSGHSITVFSTGSIRIENWIVTGYEGFDPATGLPNSSGDPVNVGLVAQNYVFLGAVPRICRVDAALMAVNYNWRTLDTNPASYPPYLTGPVDLDLDGIVGESPVNNDPGFGLGWDEVNLTPDHWVLNISGPIITHNQGSASPWSSSAIAGGAPGPTRRYNYDLDITEYPPPCFPVPLNLWVDVSWTEVFDTTSPLETMVP